MTAQAGLFVARDSGGNGTTPKGARGALAGLLAKNADGTVRTGVLADGQGPVVTGAAGMTYNVRKHVAVTKATEANGPVLVPNDGTVSVATDPAPGSNSRIDIIYIWQPLVTGDGGSETTVAPVIGVAKGTAGAVPVAPTGLLPPGALELARVPVPSGTTATSGLTFTPGAWTTTTGGPLPNTDGKYDTDWIAPTMGTNWVNFGGGRAPAGYRLHSGEVWCRGMVKSGITNTIFQFGPGFRPEFIQRFDCSSDSGAASMDVYPNGDVTISAYKAGGSNGSIDLSIIKFIPKS